MRKIFFLMMAAVCSLMVVKAADVTAATGYAGLKSALNAANSGDVIRVEVGIYTADDEELVIKPGVEVIGGFIGDPSGWDAAENRIYPGAAVSKDEMTILDGNSLLNVLADKHRVATVKGTLEGVVIRNGHVRNGNGGGVLIDGGLVLNCIIRGNVAMTVAITDPVTPSLGGGAYLQNGGKIVNCVVAYNMANNGYGIAGAGEVVNNTITANTYAPEAVAVLGTTYKHYKHWITAGSLPWTTFNAEEDLDAQLITISDFHIAATETTTSQFAVFTAAMDLVVSTDGNDYVSFKNSPFAEMKDPTDGSNVTTRMNFEAVAAEYLFQVRTKDTYGLQKVGADYIYNSGRANEPMTYVNWYGGLAYSVWLGGTLPTEGQWELAARSKGTSDLDTYMYANSEILGDVAWHKGNSGSSVKEVAQKNPTALNIFDMSGSVWEWCADWSNSSQSGVTSYPDYTTGSFPYNTLTDPIWRTGTVRARKGGSWDHADGNLALAFRSNNNPLLVFNTIGVRPVLVSAN